MKQGVKIEYRSVIRADTGKEAMQRIETAVPVAMTEQELEVLAQLSKPCSREIVAAHVARLATHKRMLDDASAARLLISDFVSYIFAERPKEYELYNAMDYFITNDKNPFFPPLSQVLTAVKKCKLHGFCENLDPED